MKIRDKVAIITGAARGIGKAIAERYVKEGAKVVIADLNEPGAKAVASALGPNALGIKLDITEQASIDATIAATVAHFGGLDILVNNAGIFDLAPIVEITRESYRRVYAVNVEGLLFMLQAGAKQMIKPGPRRQDHQLGLPGRTSRRGAGRHLLLVEGGGHQPHPERGPRPHQASHQRQRHRSGRGRQRALGPCRLALRQIRAPQAWREEADRRRGGALTAAWRARTRSPASRHSSPAKTPTISWRRLTTSTAATG